MCFFRFCYLFDSQFFPLWVDFYHLLWRRANTRNYHTLLSCFPVVIQFSLPGIFFAVKISWQKRQNTKFWIRCFHLTLQSTDPDSVDKREVVQYHFTSWPDHSVPRDTIAFLMFHHKLKTTLVADPGPVIIHCRSAVEIDIDSFIYMCRVNLWNMGVPRLIRLSSRLNSWNVIGNLESRFR